MKIKPGKLATNGYHLLDYLDHRELIPFVRTYLKKRTTISLFYTFSNIVIAILIIFWFWKNHQSAGFRFGIGLNYLCVGLAMAFALIPIHEYIHALAYKYQGAHHTSYDVNWKKFYFMAIADKFVANKKEYQMVALAPFFVISTTLIILLFFTDRLWSFTVLGILLTHTAFSSGDFGMLSYFEYHKDKDVVTYDDREHGISYFYGKEKKIKV
ncbi:MAG: DUF3267 domain-containing protein [Rhizobacter sp.]|nr:DUF3267 domain-containing protein [Ferruginibacter sp.]